LIQPSDFELLIACAGVFFVVSIAAWFMIGRWESHLSGS
jgi:hypothetical protein